MRNDMFCIKMSLNAFCLLTVHNLNEKPFFSSSQALRFISNRLHFIWAIYKPYFSLNILLASDHRLSPSSGSDSGGLGLQVLAVLTDTGLRLLLL